MTLRYVASCLFLISLLLVTACSRSVKTEFYVLNPVPMESTKSRHHAHLQIGIDSVRLPADLEKPQFIIRYNAHHIKLDDVHEWAETLDKTIKRITAANLTVFLPGAAVENAPWDIKFRPNWHLELIISEFDVDVAGNSTLRAEYLIYNNEQLVIRQSVCYQIKVDEICMDKLVRSQNENI